MELSTEFAGIHPCDFAQAKSTAGIVLPHRIASAPMGRRALPLGSHPKISSRAPRVRLLAAYVARAELRFGGERFVTRRGCPARSELLALSGRAEHERLMCSALASH